MQKMVSEKRVFKEGAKGTCDNERASSGDYYLFECYLLTQQSYRYFAQLLIKYVQNFLTENICRRMSAGFCIRKVYFPTHFDYLP